MDHSIAATPTFLTFVVNIIVFPLSQTNTGFYDYLVRDIREEVRSSIDSDTKYKLTIQHNNFETAAADLTLVIISTNEVTQFDKLAIGGVDRSSPRVKIYESVAKLNPPEGTKHLRRVIVMETSQYFSDLVYFKSVGRDDRNKKRCITQ